MVPMDLNIGAKSTTSTTLALIILMEGVGEHLFFSFLSVFFLSKENLNPQYSADLPHPNNGQNALLGRVLSYFLAVGVVM